MVRDRFRRLRDLVIANFSNLEIELKEDIAGLKKLFLDNIKNLFEKLNINLNTLETLIDQSYKFTIDKITEYGVQILEKITKSTNDIFTLISNNSEKVIKELTNVLTDLKIYVKDSFLAQRFNIENITTTQTETLISAGEEEECNYDSSNLNRNRFSCNRNSSINRLYKRYNNKNLGFGRIRQDKCS